MPFSSELLLPPPFSLVTLRELGDAFAHAKAIAAESGAGTIVYVGRFDLAEFAVVLEPDEPLRTARRTFYAAMCALAEALIALAPPETPVDIVWPDALAVNAGGVGGGRLGWPRGAQEDKPPDWLVFGAMIRTVSMSDAPGLHPLSTALEEEGFTDFAAARLVESFARHLMLMTDTWQERGFAAIAHEYLRRLPRESGTRRDIDENGDLLIRRVGRAEPERRQLLPALAKPSWLDPKTGGPRL
ncbi:MAG TPA: biotin/lipoate--protein ligase family protein [Rhizomicrobium sp.]|jgi:biotin-(acetyl-CoA carboxylase) ligase|nr:biotin/lipoate--protein ligase family protein [Rhizomicrobium sp.]